MGLLSKLRRLFGSCFSKENKARISVQPIDSPSGSPASVNNLSPMEEIVMRSSPFSSHHLSSFEAHARDVLKEAHNLREEAKEDYEQATRELDAITRSIIRHTVVQDAFNDFVFSRHKSRNR